MKYITMSKITEEQQKAFIAALQRVNDTDGGLAELLDLAGWLYSGSAHTVNRKGNPVDILNKIADTKHVNAILRQVHNNDGTLLACNGYMIAVILPGDKPEWDFSDAYGKQENGDLWSLPQKMFSDCRQLDAGVMTVEQAETLLTACKAHIEEFKRTKSKAELRILSDGGYLRVPIYINAESMDAITETEFKELVKNAGKPICLNASHLEIILRFMLCAGEDIEVFIAGKTRPIFFHSKNLYVTNCPINTGE